MSSIIKINSLVQSSFNTSPMIGNIPPKYDNLKLWLRADNLSGGCVTNYVGGDVFVSSNSSRISNTPLVSSNNSSFLFSGNSLKHYLYDTPVSNDNYSGNFSKNMSWSGLTFSCFLLPTRAYSVAYSYYPFAILALYSDTALNNGIVLYENAMYNNFVYSVNRPRYMAGQYTSNYVNINHCISFGRINHIIFRHNTTNNTVSIWSNGILNTTVAFTQSIPTARRYMVMIGNDDPSYTANDLFYAGLLDEIMLWNTALSDSEVAELITYTKILNNVPLSSPTTVKNSRVVREGSYNVNLT